MSYHSNETHLRQLNDEYDRMNRRSSVGSHQSSSDQDSESGDTARQQDRHVEEGHEEHYRQLDWGHDQDLVDTSELERAEQAVSTLPHLSLDSQTRY